MHLTAANLAVVFLVIIVDSVSPLVSSIPISLEWGPYPPQPSGTIPSEQITIDPRQMCANLTVPVDYKRLNGHAIQISISRVQSNNIALRRGVILLNPGGPGRSGLNEPSRMLPIYPRQVLDTYDLIGFGPRGVQYSTPLNSSNRVLFMRIVWPIHVLVRYVTTANTARDMVRIRIALNETKISYFGTSYGTYLGTAYTSLYPQNSDRLVLDSNINPEGVGRKNVLSWAEATEECFDDYAQWAAKRNETYGFGPTPQQVRETYLKLVEKLDQHSVNLTDYEITGNTVRQITRLFMESTHTFPAIAKIWQVTSNPVSSVQTNSSSLLPRTLNQDFLAVQDSVICQDKAWPRNPNIYARDVRRNRVKYPITNGFAANI
ncbi:hypothetical protein K7432_000566 [Basidiobolus ranarum]|uniref:AB hydrolase-1 domain-containing protein n=1 Tax=Basidiobolus ranarum TaxID=34480 RepID=A0ABR2X4G0_9FUNG